MAGIFELLKKDHDDHRALLKQLTDSEGGSQERQSLFRRFKLDALSHASAEEQSLYAAMLADPDLSDEGRHSTAEHKEIEDHIDDLEEMEFGSSEWESTFGKLRKRYEHHIDEEEEETFEAARKKFSAEKRQELGARFSERKPEEKKEEREERAA